MKFESFYVKKDVIGIKYTKNDIIIISNSIHFDNYYSVIIYYDLLERFIKISKLINNDKIDNLLKLVYLCEDNKMKFDNILEEALVKELSKTIWKS